MASSINALSSQSASSASSSSNSASGLGSSAPSEEMFLQLLVSQIKNQDPLNPTDSTQFVSQLAQFSELEQVMAIRGDLDTMSAGATQATSGSSSATSGSGTNNNQSSNTNSTTQTQS